MKTGRIELADAAYSAAIAAHRELKNRRFEGIHMCDQALCRLAQGRLEEASQIWRAGAAILVEVGDPTMLSVRTASMREACARAGVPDFEKDA
jgi:hypothetical protein